MDAKLSVPSGANVSLLYMQSSPRLRGRYFKLGVLPQGRSRMSVAVCGAALNGVRLTNSPPG